MDDACPTFLQIVSKGFTLFITGFLNLSCYISTRSANLKTECTSDRPDESWLTSKGELYLKGKSAASLICFIWVFSILILNFVSKQSNSQKMSPPHPTSLPNMGCFQDTMVQSGPNEVLPLVKWGLYLCSSFSSVMVAKSGTSTALWLLRWFCTGEQSLSHLCCSLPLRTLLAGHHSYMDAHLCNSLIAFPLCAQRHPWNANISHDFWIQVLSAHEWGGTEKITLSKMSEPSISAFSELQWHRA